MTDTEIFENELECIQRRNDGECNGGTDCAKCDLVMDCEEIKSCYLRSISNILKLEYQQQKIAELKAESDCLVAQLRSAYDQIARLKRNTFTDSDVKNLQLEAVTKFAELLAESIWKSVDKAEEEYDDENPGIYIAENVATVNIPELLDKIKKELK